MKLPSNTHLVKQGRYINFRKQYNGQMIDKSWPVAQEKQALEDIYEILRKINRKQEIFELEETRITMIQAADTFWERHAKAATENGNDSFPIFLARIKEYFKTAWYDSITHEEVKAFLKWLAETPFQHPNYKKTPARLLKVGTINGHHRCLISIFNAIPRWVELGKIERVKLPKQKNPASLIEKPSEEEFTRTRVLSLEEMERLIGACAKPRTADIIKADFFFLLRYEDLKKAKIESAKAGKSVRGIQGKTGDLYDIATNGYFLAKLDFTNFPREFKAAVKKANILDFQFRDLRRTGATHLFRQTNDLALVQRRLGHASPAMTKKYLGIMDSDNVKGSEILGGILASLNPMVTVEPVITEKACVKCKEVKDLEEGFYKNHSHKDGYNSACKVCSTEVARVGMAKIRHLSPGSSGVERSTHIRKATGSKPVQGNFPPKVVEKVVELGKSALQNGLSL